MWCSPLRLIQLVFPNFLGERPQQLHCRLWGRGSVHCHQVDTGYESLLSFIGDGYSWNQLLCDDRISFKARSQKWDPGSVPWSRCPCDRVIRLFEFSCNLVILLWKFYIWSDWSEDKQSFRVSCHDSSGSIDFSDLFLSSSMDWTVKLWSARWKMDSISKFQISAS